MLVAAWVYAGPGVAAASSTISIDDAGALIVEEVVVTGRRPGPPLWRVTSAQNTLWLFGTVNPLPRSLEWDDASVTHLLDGAGGLLLPPNLSMSTSNPLRALGMLRRFNAAKKLPKGDSLEDVLPADTLAQWHAVIERFGLKARRYERLKPLFAGEAVLEDALASIGLESDDDLLKALKRLAKRHDVELLTADVAVEIDDGLNYFESITDQDSIACLQTILGALDRDVSAARDRAIAWADGDASGLVEFDTGAVAASCRTTPLDGAGAADARRASRLSWLESAEALLGSHSVSLAVLPIAEIVGEDGLVSALRLRGYEVHGQGTQSSEASHHASQPDNVR